MKLAFLPRLYLIAFLAVGFGGLQRGEALDPRLYAVEVSALAQTNPPRIILSWRADPDARSYTISRKALESSTWGPGVTLPGTATSYTDTAVQTGNAYEYKISKIAGDAYLGYGYIYAGLHAPLTEERGKLILIVDNRFSTDLASQLGRLEQDLVGDGWRVLRHDVAPETSPASVKALIVQDYNADPTRVKSVFLFGHIPVAYSGNFAADGHLQHQGAWPADVFYADVNGTWSDSLVNTTNAEREVNWNIPNDGKFDQSELPSDVELEIGRVDLSNMTCYSNKDPGKSEMDLLKQYLDKDHRFRHRMTTVARRGLVADGMGDNQGLRFGVNAWRNYAPMLGYTNVVETTPAEYISATTADSFLWTFSAAGGGFFSSEPIGDSNVFVTNDVKAVFTTFAGSYFGDWDNESNFLRAPLGSTTYTLTASYTGLPYWFYHHMGLGLPIGHSTRVSQNNRTNGTYSPQIQGTRGVHTALMGDPTLRLHPVAPPFGVSAQASGRVVSIDWNQAPDSDVVGYHVYRATNNAGPFVRISGSPVTATSFSDTPAVAGTYVYMVKTLKLERCPSGTYTNSSQGVFQTAVTLPGPLPPTPPNNLVATPASSGAVQLMWSQASNDEQGFKVERRSGASPFNEIAVVGPDIVSYLDTTTAAETSYNYRVRAYNAGGGSAYSNEASLTTPALEPVVVANAGLNEGKFSMQLRGTMGSQFAIESSADLKTWRSEGTNSFDSATFDFTENVAPGEKFYRIRSVR